MALTSSRILETKAITVTATAQTLEDLGLDTDNIAAADIAMITVNSACYFILGGSIDPTSSSGHYLSPLIDREFPGNGIVRSLKLIRIGGSDITGFVTLAKI